jgi:hypothetical protein
MAHPGSPRELSGADISRAPDELLAKLRGVEVKLPTLADMLGPQDVCTISPDRAYIAVVSLSSPRKIRVFDLANKRRMAESEVKA